MKNFTFLLICVFATSCRTMPDCCEVTASCEAASECCLAEARQTSPAEVLNVMKQVADWQLVNPSPSAARYREDAWTYAAFYAGLMALDDIADTPKYGHAMLEVGKRFNWQLAPRIYHADDHCIGQTYLELYFKHGDPAMMKGTKERMDYILAHPSSNELVYERRGTPPGSPPEADRSGIHTAHRYWWCDALFMGPPTWARLAKASGDRKYLDYMDKEWWTASDFLYDKDEHLYFRDSRYFTQREANGKKIFWARGNGWVMGGLARVLEVMPKNYPSRPRYEQQFKEMAAKIASLQQPDGLWRASLLDPDSYPLKETSGSGFYTFALAWGVNNGLLDRAAYEPVVRKGWQALVDCVTPEGKLEHVQPVGADPKKFLPTDYEVYGAGAFLLAGKEMYRLTKNQGARIQKIGSPKAVGKY